MNRKLVSVRSDVEVHGAGREYVPPTGCRAGCNCVWRIEMPGTMIAGNVRERRSGGGVLCAQHFPVDVWAATAAAAALSQTIVK